MTDHEFVGILKGCKHFQRSCQYQLHGLLYHYAMNIARRYSGSTESAEEVVNDAFFKVFTKIDQFVPGKGEVLPAFRAWFRRIVINTAIDRCRSALNTPYTEEWTTVSESAEENGLVEQLTLEQVLQLMDRLPMAYRTVFGLFVADGYSHEEIAALLKISVGASKSNLSRARQHLKRLLSNEIAFNQNI